MGTLFSGIDDVSGGGEKWIQLGQASVWGSYINNEDDVFAAPRPMKWAVEARC